MAANLTPLSRLAREVIVGADESVSDRDKQWYASVADSLATYPFTGPNEFRGWLRGLASGDWILFLDGDELVSNELMSQLPGLLSARHIGAYALSRRWVFPSPDVYLSGRPWTPDWQVRLVRNDDRLWFPSRKHTGPAYLGPTRRVDAPLLHLDLMMRSHKERLDKVRKYDEESIGLMVDGRPINAAYYLPEESGRPQTRELPKRDADSVQRSLGATRVRTPPRRSRRHTTRVRSTVADIEATLPWTPLSSASAKADIHVLDAPTHVPAGTHFWVRLSVTNRGERVWPFEERVQPMIRCSYRWLAGGEVFVRDGLRTVLPHDVFPNDTADLDMLVQAPALPGEYDLNPDLVAEGERWFGSPTSCRIRIDDALAKLASHPEFLSLEEMRAIRQRVPLEDSLSWYLSERAMAQSSESAGESVSPQAMQARNDSPGVSVAQCLHDADVRIVFYGDVEMLESLVLALRDVSGKERPLHVLPTGSVNARRIRSYAHASSLSGVHVLDSASPDPAPAEPDFVCILGFHQYPLTGLRLNELKVLQARIAEPHRLLVMEPCTDLSLAVMSALESTSIAGEFRVRWGQACVGEGVLLSVKTS